MSKTIFHLAYISITIICISCNTVRKNQSATTTPLITTKAATTTPLIATETTATLTPTIPAIATETKNDITTTQTPEFNLTPAIRQCQMPGYPGTIHYANEDKFGDGYISRVVISSVKGKNDGEIVLFLVNQWLEHYKTRSKSASATTKDYRVERVSLIDTSCDPFFRIVAGVRFSVIPIQTPNDYAGFPGETISPTDPWWDLGAPFGVFKDGDFYRLRLVFGFGT